MALFYIDVACVMRDSAIHHRFGHLCGLAPDGLGDILLEFYLIFLALLQVAVLIAPAVATESFVVAGVRGISNIEGAEHWGLQRLFSLFIELLSRAESHHIGVEGTVLADNVRERLVAVGNLAVKLSVIVSL